MEPTQVRQMLTAMVPFIRTVGLEVGEVERGRATAILPSRREVRNHLGTAHAGAIYTLGESASGAVVLSLFGELLPGAFIALKAAQVTHLKAMAGDARAVATLAGAPDAVRATYDGSGKVDFDVHVAVDVDGVPTAEITYTWAVRAPR